MKSPYCTLTDIELIEKVEQLIKELIDTGGKSWTMQIPARPNADHDLIFTELNQRFKAKTQTGAVWVKAEKVRDNFGITYHAKDEESKGAGLFDIDGHFKWEDGSITFKHCQEDLWILDESAAGREDAVELLRWLNENDWSGVGSGEYINSTNGRILKEEKLYQEFKRREK